MPDELELVSNELALTICCTDTNVQKDVNLLITGQWLWLVSRAIASDTRGPRFESNHRKIFIYILNICSLSTEYWKEENKEKEAGNGPFFKTH